MTLVDNYLTGVPSGVEGIMDFDSVERAQLDDWDHVEDDLEKLMGQMIRKQPPKKSPSTGQPRHSIDSTTSCLSRMSPQRRNSRAKSRRCN